MNGAAEPIVGAAGSPRRLPPPDPRSIGGPPPRWHARPELATVTPAWVRAVLPRTIPVLQPAPRSNHPLVRAGATTALRCVVWGGLIGCCAGATAGTLIVPLFGTAYGGLIGAPAGATVGAAWAPLTVTVLALRHRRVVGPHAALVDVGRVVGTLPVLLGVLSAAIVVAFVLSDSPVAALWATAVVTATMAVVIGMLRPAVRAISQAWCAPFGWRRV